MPNQEAGLENLEPAVRLEEILDGQDIEPATRLEYFLKKAAEGGGGGVSGEYLKVYNGADLLSEPISVVSDINGQPMQYTGGVNVIARDYENNEINCRLVDASVLNSPFVYSSTGDVFWTEAIFDNTDDINPFIPDANMNSNAEFYVKEILPNAKVAMVSDVDTKILCIDSNYVTLGYGYTKKLPN